MQRDMRASARAIAAIAAVADKQKSRTIILIKTNI